MIPVSTGTTKTKIDRRRAVDELIAEYNRPKGFQSSLFIARKTLAARYLKRPHADVKLPDAEPIRSAFWLMVSEAVTLPLEEL